MVAINKKYSPDINLNLNVRGLAPSATLEINERSNRLIQEGKHVYKFGLGQSPFPVPEPVVEALKENAFQKNYLAVKGLAELRQAVADYHCRLENICYQAEDVLIGPGSKELMFILQLVYYGDLVIPTPSWVSYAPQAHIIGRKIQWIPTHPENGWRLLPEEIEKLCSGDPKRPRLLILNYPNNPSGVTYQKEELRLLAKTARKYKLVLLSDEIYGQLHHRGQHVSIARYYPEGTIISSGLSKWCGAGGWRLGTFVFPSSLRWLLDAMAAVASETFTATSAPIQYAAVRAFQGGPEIERYLKNSRKILGGLGRALAKKLQSAGAGVPEPQGGFYLFPEFSRYKEKFAAQGIHTGQDFCKKLLDDTGVAILPGSAFGRPAAELSARLAYVNFDGRKALQAAAAIPSDASLPESFLRKYCGEAMTGIELMCEWLSE